VGPLAQLEALRNKPFPYPLKLEPKGRQKYFEEREKFDITVNPKPYTPTPEL